MTNIAAMHINGKNIKKSFSLQNQLTGDFVTQYVASGTSQSTIKKNAAMTVYV